MMCLGKNWDLNQDYMKKGVVSMMLEHLKSVEFKRLVDEVLHASHVFLRQSVKHVDELPLMSPDIAFALIHINAHHEVGTILTIIPVMLKVLEFSINIQDIDESRESIEKGLPVVSFSIGDTAEFLYGNGRDADGAKKVLLESGDVLIFGGKSRLIYHGVSCIKPNSSPERLTDEAKLRPGRLNLTFRQY
ncbi:alkylated DNA repair protein [Apostasia shenzhenica]|uniref:Alkylated DNA repair protein n=1 Tax=Apostasia shenzhenica TaxID=1088818 RepID=A0A2I0BH62_9ASPA|nr:alkylated DNA repair protein [Apostasia shenzhenica]